MSLEFSARKQLGAFTYDATFDADQEIVVLFGHSGAGKSITLQMVAGLMRPGDGHIAIDGNAVFDSATSLDLPPQRRGVGYVVQDLALFNHMTVEENVAFGVRRDAASDRVAALLDLLGLTGYERRRPRSLSGGQQQRVALARALARDARLLLLDEPFSALDDALRSTLRRELLRLRRELGLTIVFVTHDLREAHLLADRLAVFDDGRLLQFDEREELFRRPRSRRVAELTGVSNIFTAEVSREDGALRVLAGGMEFVSDGACDAPPGQRVDVAIRAERAVLRRALNEGEAAKNVFTARIAEEFAYGSTHTLRLEPTGLGIPVEVEIAARPYEILGVRDRREWLVELPPADLHVMLRAE